jgi:hypothetical protein
MTPDSFEHEAKILVSLLDTAHNLTINVDHKYLLLP